MTDAELRVVQDILRDEVEELRAELSLLGEIELEDLVEFWCVEDSVEEFEDEIESRKGGRYFNFTRE